MKFLLKLIVAIASVIGIVLVIALFVDRSFTVERSKALEVTPDRAFAILLDIENQGDINPWITRNNETSIWYEGTPGQIGHKICWESNDERIGKGEQEIIAFEEGKQIDYRFRLFQPQEMESDVQLRMTALSVTSTKITCRIKGFIPYPRNLNLLFKNMEEEIGEDINKGLRKLQSFIIENK